ncbi:MAG: Tat pathway signal protein [Acidobacteriaceae bacterium]|nr:Tat pathway signal protein [Acidobacteriaceae bacterium]
MQRRQFLHNVAGFTTALELFPAIDAATSSARAGDANGTQEDSRAATIVCEFTLDGSRWTVHEDLSTREGAISFVSEDGDTRVLGKSAEAAFAEANPPFLGLSLKDIGMSARDLLAEKLLSGGGDPDPENVKAAAPPQGSAHVRGMDGFRLPWDSFVGTKECKDTMPVFPGGNTRTYHPNQYFPQLTAELAHRRFEGLLGGWFPAVRKVMPVSDKSYFELLIFADVEAKDEFIVQTWHRTAQIEDGRISKVVYGYSYPAFPPARQDPTAQEFYRALLVLEKYWRELLSDLCAASVPERVWVDLSQHAFAKELIVRPGGVYPKYGAVDRDYYGSEYDGFQDIFTSSVYSNLEWGRFEQAKLTIDNYFTSFVDSRGAVNMRGPETAQYGLTLSLLARYFRYTQDAALLRKYQQKIAATAGILTYLHDESLRLDKDNPGYGLIHGWSESDSCLMPKPATWWQPYFNNSAFAVRGLRDIAQIWTEIEPGSVPALRTKQAQDWLRRSQMLRNSLLSSIEKSVRRDLNPPYVGPLPGVRATFLESITHDRPSVQGWPHRAYSELLQADVLPAELANLVIDTLRAYGGTTVGVVANIEPPHADGRDILGFISYGYAQMLLRLDRIEEYLLFLYSHRYHDHTRGSWTAGEVAGITGDSALFCIPAQLTIPLLVRWMLLLEDSDEDRLYIAKGIPRAWLSSGEEIAIEKAPTRWGRVSFSMRLNNRSQRVLAQVQLAAAGSPGELHVKFRLPVTKRLESVTVNGNRAIIGGRHNDTVIVKTDHQQSFELSGQLG